jgi:hypothetical protein
MVGIGFPYHRPNAAAPPNPCRAIAGERMIHAPGARFLTATVTTQRGVGTELSSRLHTDSSGSRSTDHTARRTTDSDEKLLAPRWPYDHCDTAKGLPTEGRSLDSEFQRRCGNKNDGHRRQSISFLRSHVAAMDV